jgi:hypothetical protein
VLYVHCACTLQQDLEGVDILLAKSMNAVRGEGSSDSDGSNSVSVTEEQFSDVVMETFTAISLDDR